MTFQRGNKKAGKLTGEQVMEIRYKYSQPGITQPMLAREYHVSLPTISNIVNWVTWQNVAYEPPSPRPPLNPSPPSQTEVEASGERLKELLDNPPKFQIPDLGASEPTGEGISRFEREANKLKPSLSKRVENELDKLEKGD